MITLDDFEAVKRWNEDLKRARDQKIGALEEMKKTLKKDFGCSTAKEAFELEQQMADEENELRSSYNANLEEFRTALRDYESKVKGQQTPSGKELR